MRYRTTPELSGGFSLRSDPQAWAWRAQTGAALPFGARHSVGALAWHDGSYDWNANQVVGQSVLSKRGSVTGLGAQTLLALRSGPVIDRAVQLIREHRLRSLDAIHLAVALEDARSLAGDDDLVFATGEESAILEGVPPGAWDATDEGILFVTGAVGPMTRGVSSSDALEFYRFADRQVHRVGELPFLAARFGVRRVLIASRDGRSIVIGRIDRWDRDIMVIDNFR